MCSILSLDHDPRCPVEFSHDHDRGSCECDTLGAGCEGEEGDADGGVGLVAFDCEVALVEVDAAVDADVGAGTTHDVVF